MIKPEGRDVMDGSEDILRLPDLANATELPAKELDVAAREIREVARTTLLTFVDEVGRIILQRFHGGDVQRWRSHAHGKVTLRELAARLDGCGLSATSLYRAIATHVFLEEHPEMRRLERITPTHMRYVLPLPEPRQTELLRQADACGWSVNDLRREAGNDRTARKRPAKPAPDLFERVAQMTKIAQDVVSERSDRRLSDEQAVEAAAAVMVLRGLIDSLQERLSPKRRALVSRKVARR